MSTTTLTLSTKLPSDSDISMMVSWLNNKKLMRYSEQRHKKHSTMSQWAYINTMVEPNVFWTIKQDGGLIGTAAAYIDEANLVADLGILIADGGRGYGTAVWKLCMHELFRRRMRKIEAGCMSCNDAMMRICEKSGMLIEGWRNRHFQLEDGSYSHSVLWGKFV